eukprot:12261634-Karenia_brevis.AAC.1
MHEASRGLVYCNECLLGLSVHWPCADLPSAQTTSPAATAGSSWLEAHGCWTRHQIARAV